MTRQKILDKAIKRMLDYPEKFNMRWFRIKINDLFKRADDGDCKYNSCGTVCCFAGEVIIAAKGMKYFEGLNPGAVQFVAQNLLGLSDTGRQELFYTYKYYIDAGIHNHKEGTKAYAKAAVRAIKNYFKDNPLQEAA